MRLIRYPFFAASWKMGESWEIYGFTVGIVIGSDERNDHSKPFEVEHLMCMRRKVKKVSSDGTKYGEKMGATHSKHRF